MSTYALNAPFAVFTRVGTADSNTWIGRSQLLGHVYRRIELPKGTVIVDWPGGVFAVVNGQLINVKPRISTKHPFEKTYLPLPTFKETWSDAKLLSLQPSSVTGIPSRPTEPSERFPLPVPGATQCENGIDWVLS